MSLLLDALRRSEEERHSSNQPTSHWRPHYRTQRRIPRVVWFFLAFALLLNVAIILYFVFDLRLLSQPAPQQATNPAQTTEPVTQTANIEPNQPVGAKPSIKLPPPPTPMAEMVHNHNENTNIRPLLAELSPAEPRQKSPSTAFIPPPPQAPVQESFTAANLSPSASASRTKDLSANEQKVLNQLELNSHFYSSKQNRRFALINMEKYREGQTIRTTPYRIAEIQREGVLIDYGSGEVLLTVEE